PAVQFDNTIRLEADKIDDGPADRMLSPKLKAVDLPAPQQTPQFPLGVGGLGAKTPGKVPPSWRPIVRSQHDDRTTCFTDASRTPTPTLPLSTGREGRNRPPI